MKFYKSTLILMILLACNLALSAAIPASERQALIDLYNSTNGDGWPSYFKTGWKTAPLHSDGFALPGTENTWYGITTDSDNTTVQKLMLSGHNQLVGTLPASLGDLNNLTFLDLNSNQLSGSIPASLGNLSNLIYLYLYSNQLTGSIPAGLGNLGNLISLFLDHNQLTGSIPASFGNLSNLIILNLSTNQLTGIIPGELGNLGNLKKLYLEWNRQTGPIPPELGNLSNLKELNLDHNQLTGSIPGELGNLGNLWWLNLGYNQLMGSIPAELSKLSNLKWLFLNSNKLSGDIPVSLGILTRLFDLYFHSDIGYNALHTSDAGLILFLNRMDPDWAATQTIAPTHVSAVLSGASSINISWTPILYTGDPGGYRIFVGTDSGGPYTLFAQTANKSISSQLVTGLAPCRTYYFVVQTRTDAHTANPNWTNQNVVDSENSAEVSATTPVFIPRIALSKTSLVFGSMVGGGTTSPQPVVVSNSGVGTLNWTAASGQGWITAAPGAGTGTGAIDVSVNPSGLTAGTYTGTVSVAAPGAFNSPQMISVRLKVIPDAGQSPFGFCDTPTDGSSVNGSVPVTGWALDDIEVTGVKIYRDPVEGEPTQPNGLVFIGDAIFVEGARPDVEQIYPGFPLNERAGWGYMMLSNFLPNGGNGTFRIHAIATDKEGNTTLLGSKTITCNNANATLPFGAIDVPSQGGTASGSSFINYAWVLATGRKCIPTDGSTITAWVDGLPVGHPSYGYYRVDIATLFPGYCNANGAIGYIPIDTTKYLNGVHTIVWSATDSGGVNNGFGSRYFTIQNSGASGAPGVAFEKGGGIPEWLTKESRDIVEQRGKAFVDLISPVNVRRGFGLNGAADAVYPNENGSLRVEIHELERVAIYFNPEYAPESTESLGISSAGSGKNPPSSPFIKRGNFSAYQVVGDDLRPLPIGSTFDTGRGILYWQPGPGFIGEYVFVFLDGLSPAQRKIPFRILIRPITSL